MRLYLRAVSYFRPDWPLICLWIFLTCLATGLGLLAAWPMAILVDTLLNANGLADLPHRLFLTLLPHHRLGQIIALAAAGLLLKVFGDLLGAVQTIVCNQVNYNGLMRVRCELYRKLQSLSMSYHKSRPQADAIYRLSSDSFGCQTILGGLVSTAVAAGTLGVMAAVLGSRSVSLTLASFAILPFLACANVAFGRRLKDRSLLCKEQDSHLNTVLHQSLSCIALVQAFGREKEEFAQFHLANQGTIRAWWKLNREQITYNLLIGALFGVGGAVVFGYGGYLVYRGSLSVGELMVFMSYLPLVWGPLCTLTGFSANLQGGVAGVERIFEVLDSDPIIRDKPSARPLPRQPRVLQLEEVSFSYGGPGAPPVLDRISVTIGPGEMVAFVGSSGVGKSTLLNLLPRFYDPTEGAMRLDGIDVRDVRIADLRRHVALVLQESVILPTTIAQNIAYGRPGASSDQIEQAARLAGASAFIEQLPQRYNTPIAEGGHSLSGGQRQRIAIARALLTDAPFIVLDEPTSALDPLHEQLITETLGSLKRQRTIILVSHRLSTVRECDQIFVMDVGRIVERGTHQQLINQGGIYTKMSVQQMPPTAPRLATAA